MRTSTKLAASSTMGYGSAFGMLATSSSRTLEALEELFCAGNISRLSRRGASFSRSAGRGVVAKSTDPLTRALPNVLSDSAPTRSRWVASLLSLSC